MKAIAIFNNYWGELPVRVGTAFYRDGVCLLRVYTCEPIEWKNRCEGKPAWVS